MDSEGYNEKGYKREHGNCEHEGGCDNTKGMRKCIGYI